MSQLSFVSSSSCIVGAALLLTGCVQRHYADDRDYGPPHSSSYRYYHEGDYETDCHRNNEVVGTIFGAIQQRSAEPPRFSVFC